MRHERKRRLLSPVLADEPLIGQDLSRRVRVVLTAVVIAFVLTNFTSYLIGQTVRADAERDNRARIAGLERTFAADLEERRKARDAEVARQDGELRQLREDACTLADRIVPRDAAVQKLRQRYRCTGDARPNATPPPDTGGPPGGTGDGGTAARPPAGPGGQRPSRPEAPAPRPPAAPPAPPAPAPDPDDGLICLPLLGCVL